MFEQIFEEVMQMISVNAWYELFDSDDFEIVEERISAELGYDCWEDEEFVVWYREMAEDL
jgi:hypothetical protein